MSIDLLKIFGLATIPNMNIYVPETNLTECAKTFDPRLLRKHRIETLHTIKAILDISKGWTHHPTTKMWKGHESALAAYGIAICEEFVNQGGTDAIAPILRKIVEPDATNLPSWWGTKEIHESHRSALIRRLPSFYVPLWPNTSSKLPLVWPKR
jgi:hypothetical protein